MPLTATLLLSGCNTPTQTEIATQTAKETITEIYKTLPDDCKGTTTDWMIKKATQEIEKIESDCKIEIKAVESEKREWMMAFLIALIVCVFLIKRGMK